MQELRSVGIKYELKGKMVTFNIKEKDMDDSINYEVYLDDHYILTLSKEGEIVFNNSSPYLDASELPEAIEELKKNI